MPALIGVPGKNPGLETLIPDSAVILPSQVGPYLQAATVLSGLPANIPGAATKASMNIPQAMANKGQYYVLGTIAAWKSSAQGKSAGWQDPAADAYMKWIREAYGNDDPAGKAIVSFLSQVNASAGFPAWLTGQLSLMKQPAPSTKARTVYTEPTLGPYQDLTRGKYRLSTQPESKPVGKRPCLFRAIR